MSVFSQQLAFTNFQRLFDQSTDALKTNIGLTGECKVQNPPKNGVSRQLHRRSLFLYRRFNRCLCVCLLFKSLHRRVVFRHRQFIRHKTLASASGFIALMPSLCSSSVHPVYSPDLAFSESIAPVTTICLSSVQPVIVNCLCSDLFDLVSSGSLIFLSL